MDLFKDKTTEEANKVFDEIRLVTHHLRHSCDNETKLRRAVKTIAFKANLSENRVEEILLYMFKGKYEEV